MAILYFDPTKCEEPKPVDYKYSDIPGCIVTGKRSEERRVGKEC